jgi:hypothetical protein
MSKQSTNKRHIFKPLRMTVQGQAGTGKTVLINTLVGIIRRMTRCNQSVHVATPTGSAAFTVQGQTLHRLCQVGIKDHDMPMSEEKKNLMGQDFLTTLAVFIDERGLVGQPLLGAAETHVSQTAHGYGHDYEDWGGIPVVVIIGDDYQLPPVLAPGAFNSFTATHQSHVGAMSNGCHQFLSFAKCVMELTEIMRQSD